MSGPINPVTQYMLMHTRALTLLEFTRDQFEVLSEDASLDDGLRYSAFDARIAVATQIGHLEAAHEAYMLRIIGPGVPPPSQEVIDATRELVKELAEKLVTRAENSAAIEIATDVVTRWGNLVTNQPLQVAKADDAATLATHSKLDSARKPS